MIKFMNQKTKGVFIMEKLFFEEWVKQWVENKKNFIKESSYANYKTIVVNHLIPVFGKMLLSDITYQVIQEHVLQWVKNGRIDGNGGLSNKTIKDMVMVLKMCLRDAGIDEYQITRKNGVLYPNRNNKDTIFCLSEQSFQAYIDALMRDLNPENIGFIMCLYTGVRIGEICALQWKDIDFNEKVVFVSKTIQRVYIKGWENKGISKVIITKPKSKKSIRTIPISDTVFDLLVKYRKDEEIYIVTGTKKYIEPRLYRKHYKIFVENHSLEYIKFHGLRHTFATRCIKTGADYKTVSELLGHASVNLTLNLYVHPHMEEKRKCVNLL